ncbi:hypothetical protein AIOL_002703 [Candidatus Rhodobacter oscarellae]|uniref:Uncharacterized protein n=1 Tax=Candidatus Rhodobacter oscarellae TaxID=1675527 RepID=A0A0J9E4R3_9RHOB|nr:DUF6525 family protein [Candidatus Rhodobacter lobularis]KMW57736.1 hypothetical protein AIOL_002703 [Candidatus Rhodobacter lobularis]
MTHNLGEIRLRRKRRAADPMRTYDALPTPLRRWLSQAALPWSPTSARKIWARAQAKGLDHDEALALLSRAETNALARDKRAKGQSTHPTK